MLWLHSLLDWKELRLKRLGELNAVGLYVPLITISESAQSRTVQIQPVHVHGSGKRGRPRKVIDEAWLEEAVSGKRKISLTKLAAVLGVHRCTLARYLKLYGVWKRFSDITDHELDMLVTHFKQTKPPSGMRYVIGFLKSHGLRVQRSRIKRSMETVDRLGMLLRRREKIARGQYKVPRPNHLWHMDGHHKLIQWGVVIHGVIDGYCRTVGFHHSESSRLTE